MSDSMVAVDAATGEIAWFYQVTQNDVWTPTMAIGPDCDFGAGPQLFEANIDGEDRNLVGAGQKSGMFTVFDRATGEHVWSTFVEFPDVGGGIRGEAGIGDDRILVWSNNSYIDGKPPIRRRVDCGREIEFVRREIRHRLVAALTEVEQEHLQVWRLLAHLLEQRQLFTARRAPGHPEIEQ